MLTRESLTKRTVISGNDSSASGILLFKKDGVAHSRRRMAMSSWQDGFFSSKIVLKRTEHSAGTLHSPQTKNGKCDGVEKQRNVLQQRNKPVTKIVRMTDTDPLCQDSEFVEV